MLERGHSRRGRASTQFGQQEIFHAGGRQRHSGVRAHNSNIISALVFFCAQEGSDIDWPQKCVRAKVQRQLDVAIGQCDCVMRGRRRHAARPTRRQAKKLRLENASPNSVAVVLNKTRAPVVRTAGILIESC